MAAQISLLTTFLVLMCVAAKAQNSIPIFNNDVEIPDGCKEMQFRSQDSGLENFCTHTTSSYPQTLMDEYVKQWDKIMVPYQQSRAFEEVTEEYVKDPSCVSEDGNNCCTESAIKQPFFLKSDKQMMLVIQPSFFQQTIKVTRCAHEGFECFKDLDLSSYMSKATCGNEMGTTKLLVYNSITNMTEMRDVQFPVGCSCQIQSSLL